MNEIIKFTKTEELEALVGEGIRAARLRQNISQAALADTAGIALGSLRNLENGLGATVATLVRALRALKREDWLASLQPPVAISPMRLLTTKQPRQRARKAKGLEEVTDGH
jgi:transcriptional regulator with XRE-family HTH domain